MSDKKTGKVKWFDSRKGYGIIKSSLNDKDFEVFVHHKDIIVPYNIYKNLYENEEVQFKLEITNNKSTIIAVPCGHARFCQDCICEWISKDKGCPICRQKIDNIMKPMMTSKSVSNTDKCRKDRPMGAEVTSYASGSI